MSSKSALLIVFLVMAVAVLAPIASADSTVLVVKGTDFSVNTFTLLPTELGVNLPVDIGSVALFHDVASGTHLGTITLEEFSGTMLVETDSLTNAVATSFASVMTLDGLPTDNVKFSFATDVKTFPSGSVPEPSALALLSVGLVGLLLAARR